MLFLCDVVVVFNVTKSGNISRAILGERVGTLVGGPWVSTTAGTWDKFQQTDGGGAFYCNSDLWISGWIVAESDKF